MRFLCLHGMGTNSQILEIQTAALRQELHEHATFEFIDGTLPVPPSAEIKGIASASNVQFYAHYDPTIPATVVQAECDLLELIAEEGPFDGVMGFSQGAALAAQVLVRYARENPGKTALEGPFRCAVFICACQTFDTKEIITSGAQATIRAFDAAADGVLIHIPTAHIFGSRDHAYCADSRNLAEMCGNKATFDHGGGHEIPRSPAGVTKAMAEVIQEVMAKAAFVT